MLWNALVIEEQHAGHWPRPVDGDAVHHTGMHAVPAGDHHAERAVRVDDIQPLDGDLCGVRPGGGLAEGGGREHNQHQRCRDGIGAQEEELTAERLSHGGLRADSTEARRVLRGPATARASAPRF